MDRFDLSARRVATVAGYAALGLVLMAATALALLFATQSVQTGLYHLVYLRLGPSEATQTAVLTHFLAVCAVALVVPTALGDVLSDDPAGGAVLGRAAAILLGLPLLFLLASLAGLASFPTALVALALGVVAVPLVLRYRYDVRSDAISAFVGGVPVVVFLVLLVGFGLGWGWGYVVTAEEVPASSVTGTAVEMDSVPAVRDDLFAAENCEVGPDGTRRCLLALRGYEHERAAARFMARHGVRCPYQNAPASRPTGSFVVGYEGSYYRVSCSPHGD